VSNKQLAAGDGRDQMLRVRLLAMVARCLVAAFAMGALLPALAQDIARPAVPETIKAPANEQPILKAQASGSQIYTCQQGKDGVVAWTLKAPEAELRDQHGKVIGQHYAGPTWKSNDGSTVAGRLAAKADSPELGAIPWLLVTATGHSGDGVFSRVTSIQRIHTHGGQAPAASTCNASKQNTEAKSSYTADYYFYVPVK
jgi:hypothetical protein